MANYVLQEASDSQEREEELQDNAEKIEATEKMGENDEIRQELHEQMEYINKQNETIEALQAINRKLIEDLQKLKDTFTKNLVEKDETIAALQQAVNDKSQVVSQSKQALEQQKKEAKTQLKAKQEMIHQLVEKWQVEEAQCKIYKEDFEAEKKEGQELHQKLTDQLQKVQGRCKELEHNLTETKETHDALQKAYLELQQKYNPIETKSTLKRPRFFSTSVTTESEKSKIDFTQQISILSQERAKLKKKVEELEEIEGNRVKELKELKEKLHALVTQVAAYSSEVDKQKGLVTESQEKHKTEVSELTKKLNNEIKSNQELTTEIDGIREQFDQERIKQKEQIENMKTANKELMEKIETLKKPIQSQLELEEKLHQAKEENAFLRKEMSQLQSSWKVSHEDITLSKEELGRGAWGVVWVGQFRGHPVAVKELHEAIRSPLYLENIHREMSTMSQLRHPNLLQFIGAVLDHPSGNPMIITEVLDTSLRKAYDNKELTPDPGCRPVILSIMRDVAVGLNYLHCLPDPIIHRDVSSANVLLESKGDKKWKTKISDFGSANAANKAVTRLPGAEPYTAPEALAQHIMSTDSKKEQTTKMDVFSYGVLLCEIITCRFPDRDVFQNMLHQVQSINSRSMGTSDTQGSLLHSLIIWCCKDDPLERPSMSQIIKQIDNISSM
ncbi:PREDICTED: RGS domain-containing serine/threonine-protein kinase A-like [Amphimedon queenslandica]|nr:PREDICTED: RGS domain-containing serine/threonine-protein kinase A-like [Amphimedon queenslandica]XP_019858708.1 PREDICTED: RGS domain-containing serine/threonine-protein kinase A-like [Amphimedon queenslandica]|eukprot:XP_011407188.1 PREDICTED: RGS domain-containing serine/threonine-protein kinase A-like [Amphimedon queenslandica]